MSTSRALLLFFTAAIVVGGLLRFTWLSDMEYKYDEQWMFERSQRIPNQEPWPELGMVSGAGLRNPGLSVAVFVALAKVSGAHDPLELCRAVVVCNVLAFVILFAYMLRYAPGGRRESWYWGLALAAVSPLSLLLQRKLWAQSVLPIFCVAFLICWLRRSRWWGAVLWGLLGALVGQIHMSGFFFAAGFFAWEVSTGWMRLHRPKPKWLGWLIGSAIGTYPLLPWVKYVLANREHGHSRSWANVLSFQFYRHWFSDALGLGLDYSLGGHYWDFLRYPLLWTEGLYPALYLHGLAFAAGAYVFFCTGRSIWRGRFGLVRRSLAAWRNCSETASTGLAAWVGYGLLLTFSGVVVWRHYMLITFPLEWVTLAYLALAHTPRPRSLLLLLWAVQLALSLTFLHYIHEHQGAPNGDYGRAFQSQTGSQ